MSENMLRQGCHTRFVVSKVLKHFFIFWGVDSKGTRSRRVTKRPVESLCDQMETDIIFELIKETRGLQLPILLK